MSTQLLALADRWRDEAAKSWGELIEHATLQRCSDELRALVAPPVVDEDCNWRQQDEGLDHISTGCGHEFILNDASDNEDGKSVFPHCPYCAKPAIFRLWRDEPECDDDTVALGKAVTND